MIGLSKREARRTAEAVNRALKAGHPPPGQSTRTKPGAIAVAAEALKLDSETVRSRVAPRGICAKAGFPVDWKLYKQPVARIDPIAKRRDDDQVAHLRRRLAAAERQAAQAQDVRQTILGLAAQPLRPTLTAPPARNRTPGGRTIVGHLSDVHKGERVRLPEMDGVNAYDSAICDARVDRFFQKIVSLAVGHWHGPPADEIVLCLGGDLLSGMIHLELVETNDAATPKAVREIAERIAGGIRLLRREVKRPVRVISVPGNHSRLTLKPQSKRRAAHNLDLLVADFAEAALRGEKDVKFFATDSPDAYFSVYGWNFCLTHGDAMGGGGGKGYIGPIAPITKGHRLLVDNASKTGRRIHYVLTAHYHTTARTPFGWANGSVIGYNEYARDLRCDPEPAKQNLLVVHRELGVIQHQELYLGAPGEGRLYAGATFGDRLTTWNRRASGRAEPSGPSGSNGE